MAIVTGFTAARMLEIEAASIVAGGVSLDDLILTRRDGSTVNAGNVRGPQGIPGNDVDAQAQIALRAPIASPIFIGVVKAPIITYEPAPGTNVGYQKRYDNVAGFSAATAAPVGAIILLAPYGMTNHMQTHDLRGYNYSSTTGAWGALLSFYNYSAPSFINPTVRHSGSYKPQIRLGREVSSGKVVIILGDVGTTWAYPKAQIVSAFMGYTTATDSYMNGWASSMVTSLAAYDTITTPVDQSFIDKAYTDAQDVTNLATAKAYADAQDVTNLATAKAYTDTSVALINLGSGVDLNTKTGLGHYVQGTTSYATLALNYPVAIAGYLEIVGTSTFVMQRYTTYLLGAHLVYVRGLYDGTWGAWKEIAVKGSAGVSFAEAAGVIAITPVAAPGGVATAVTFPAGRFTVNPIVTVNIHSNGYMAASIGGLTTTGFTSRSWSLSGTPTGASFHWHAVQMTASSAAG